MNGVQVRPLITDCDSDDFRESRAIIDDNLAALVRYRILSECRCVVVVFNLQTAEQYRRQGLARALLQHVEEGSRKLDVSLLFATVRVDNLPSTRLCQSLGYYPAACWNNPRTGSDLILYLKPLLPRYSIREERSPMEHIRRYCRRIFG